MLTIVYIVRTASQCRRAYIFPPFFYLSVYLSIFVLSFRCLISEVTELISTKLKHIFTYDCYLQNLVRTLRAFSTIYSMGLEQKRFLRPTLNFDRTFLCNRTRYQQVDNNLSMCINSSYMPPNLVNFGQETAENGWRVFAHPLNFRIERLCPTYRMDVI